MNEIIMIIGGSASGKSEYAEQLALQLHSCKPEGSRLIYAATMQANDKESLRKIAIHRQRRINTAFETMEVPFGIERIDEMLSAHLHNTPATVLLECVSNLLANEMYGANAGADMAAERIVSGIEAVSFNCDMIIVSNEVFLGGTDYDASTIDYMRQLGYINRLIAKRADKVIELVCGIPVVWKDTASQEAGQDGEKNAFG